MKKIKLTCPRCKEKLEISAEWVGKKVRCPSCGLVVDVPKLTSLCSQCGEEFPKEKLTSYHGQVLCLDCYGEELVRERQKAEEERRKRQEEQRRVREEKQRESERGEPKPESVLEEVSQEAATPTLAQAGKGLSKKKKAIIIVVGALFLMFVSSLATLLILRPERKLSRRKPSIAEEREESRPITEEQRLKEEIQTIAEETIIDKAVEVAQWQRKVFRQESQDYYFRYYELFSPDYSYNIKKTTSIVSPYVADISFTTTSFHTVKKHKSVEDARGDDHFEAFSGAKEIHYYAYQEGQWKLTETNTRDELFFPPKDKDVEWLVKQNSIEESIEYMKWRSQCLSERHAVDRARGTD